MANTKDIDRTNTKIQVLVYGKSGVGKTHFGGTFPSPFFVAFDRKMLTLAGQDIEYEIVSTWKELEDVMANIEDIKQETLVFDSLTRYSDILMARIQAINKTTGKMPTLPEYGIFGGNIKEFLDDVLKIDKNIVFTAHEELTKDELTGEIFSLPLMIGKTRYRLASWFDEYYRLYVDLHKGEYTYYMSTVPTKRYGGKTSLGLPAVIDDPSYSKIISLVKGEDSG